MAKRVSGSGLLWAAALLTACASAKPSEVGSPAYQAKKAKVAQFTHALNVNSHNELQEINAGLTQVNGTLNQGGMTPVVGQVNQILAGGAGNILAGGAGNILSGGAGNILAGGAGNILAGGAGNILAGGAGNLLPGGAGNWGGGAGQLAPQAFTALGQGAAPRLRLLQAPSISVDPLSGELTGLSGQGYTMAFSFSGAGAVKREWRMTMSQSPDGTTGSMGVAVEATRWVVYQPNPQLRVMGGQVPGPASVQSLKLDFDTTPQGRAKLRTTGFITLDEVRSFLGQAEPAPSHLGLGFSAGSYQLDMDLRTDGANLDLGGKFAAPNQLGQVEAFTYAMNYQAGTQILKLNLLNAKAGLRLVAEGRVTPPGAPPAPYTAALYHEEDGGKLADLKPDPSNPSATLVVYTDGTTELWHPGTPQPSAGPNPLTGAAGTAPGSGRPNSGGPLSGLVN